jgi:hypothetical protein
LISRSSLWTFNDPQFNIPQLIFAKRISGDIASIGIRANPNYPAHCQDIFNNNVKAVAMSSSYTSSTSSPPSLASNPANNSTSSSKRRRKTPSKPLFTPLMQDRQARNKDPYSSTDDSEEFMWEPPNKRFDAYVSSPFSQSHSLRERVV